MSHVDEGTLHAYLDGELPPNERRDLEAHVAQCAACKERLAEERALFERASALLGSARPAERPAPPFERLRPTHRRSPWHVRMPVAWAASILLALGLGYYLREPATDQAVSGLVSQPAAPVAEEAKSERQELATADKATTAVRQTQKRRAPDTRALDAVAERERASVDSLHRADANSGVVAIQPQVQLRGAPTQAAPIPRDSALRLEGAIVTATNAVLARQREADSLAANARSGYERRSVRNLVSTTWPIISRGAAASLLGDKPVGVPGLATRRIRRSPGPDSTVVVEQALDSATVIQIFQRPATARAADSPLYIIDGVPIAREAAPAAAPAPADRLARFVGKLRVEISGPVSADSLNRLLEQVKPIEP
jgi:predicted anti-sigma-YlaC factor YlaD